MSAPILNNNAYNDPLITAYNTWINVKKIESKERKNKKVINAICSHAFIPNHTICKSLKSSIEVVFILKDIHGIEFIVLHAIVITFIL